MPSAKCRKCGETFFNSASRDYHERNEHLNDLKGPFKMPGGDKPRSRVFRIREWLSFKPTQPLPEGRSDRYAEETSRAHSEAMRKMGHDTIDKQTKEHLSDIARGQGKQFFETPDETPDVKLEKLRGEKRHDENDLTYDVERTKHPIFKGGWLNLHTNKNVKPAGTWGIPIRLDRTTDHNDPLGQPRESDLEHHPKLPVGYLRKQPEHRN